MIRLERCPGRTNPEKLRTLLSAMPVDAVFAIAADGYPIASVRAVLHATQHDIRYRTIDNAVYLARLGEWSKFRADLEISKMAAWRHNECLRSA